MVAMIEILNRYTDAVIQTIATNSLFEADLSWADLHGANLSWAKLSEADLSWATRKTRRRNDTSLRGDNAEQ
jgi:uncharacterized protein YjbI with pentapeptide repeats